MPSRRLHGWGAARGRRAGRPARFGAPLTGEPSRRALVALAAASAAVVLLRLALHPHFLLDLETSMVNTVGREWALGHATGSPTAWQIIPYQGSFLVDAGLAALGYALFGDHMLAWMWVPAAYAVAFSALGVALGARLGGGWGALAFALAWAAAPFVVKDGLFCMPGAHSSSIVWVLAAVAALERAERRDERGTAVLAGALAAFATWYTRSAILAMALLPAAMLLAGRWRLAAAVGLGLGALPLLVGLNVLGLVLDGPWEGRPPPGPLLQTFLWRVYELGDHQPALVEKAAEAFGFVGLRALFGRAGALDGEAVQGEAGTAAGAVWAVGFAAAWLGALVAGLVGLRRRRATVAAGSGLVVLYVAAYVLSPLRIEPGAFESSNAPAPTSVRYLIPGMLAAIAWGGPALGVALRAGGARRVLAGAGLAALVASGLPAALADRSDRAAELWRERVPFRYERLFGWNRGPSRARLEAMQPTDLIARASRLRALGSARAVGPDRLVEDPGLAAAELDAAVRDLALDADERRWMAHGMGLALADHLWSSEQFGGRRLVALAGGVAERFGDDGAAFLVGFAEALSEGREMLGLDGEEVDVLCAITPTLGRPLCRLAGMGLGGECDDGWLARLAPHLEGRGLDVQAEVLRGVAWRQARTRGPWSRGPCGASVPPELRAAWDDGWSSGARFLWRTEVDLSRPDRVP